MKKLNFIYAFFLAISLFHCKSNLDYKNSSLPLDKRVEAILSQMTLEEKLAQIRGYDHAEEMKNGVGFFGFMQNHLNAGEAAEEYNKIQKWVVTNTRFGIPGIRCGEGIFAYMGNGSTSFPQSIAIAATFDTSCMAQMCEALGEELKSRGIRQVYAPVVNLARDCRWGRTGETYGEDPYLTSMMGVTYCHVIGGKNIITCPKHFAANMGLTGKFGDPVQFSERLLREFYFPAFKACFQQGDAKSVMMAYNTLDGIPCHANKWLITDVLRNEWGFDGYVMSDGGAVQITWDTMGVAATREELIANTMNAGCDLSDFNGSELDKAIKLGLVSEKRIDEAAGRILKQKFRIGLFENPYVDPEYAAKINNSIEHRSVALELAKKSMVLLKNEKNVLPFSKNIKNIAVVGPLADWLLINHYGGFGRHEVTVLEGLRNILPDAKITYVKGAEMQWMGLPAIKADCFIGGLKGEYFDNKELKGEPKFVRTDKNIDFDWKEGSPDSLPADGFSVRWTGQLKSPVTGTFKIGGVADDGFRLFINDSIIINDFFNNARHLADQKYHFEKDKIYNVRFEYFENSNRAIAQLGWDINPYIYIPDAVAAAKNSDAVIAVVGMRDDENGDRCDLDLDPAQEQLIKEIAKTGKPFVVVIQTGTVITSYDWIDDVSSVLMAWYPGCEGGNAIVQTLFGDNNPGGKLPLTFPKVTGQVPMNYNALPGKTDDKYIGINGAMFPFGHGLSYTTFEYSSLKLSRDKMKADEMLNISVDVKNTGKIKGDDVVQLYIHDIAASVSQPTKKLKGFKRITLEPGTSQTVSFRLSKEELSIWDINMKYVVEPGLFDVMIGSSSEDIRLKTTFEVVE
jgi:beta-glucosidase